jgi:DNA-binding response OmpR family regulator
MRLLLCEDERSLSKAIVTILEKSNYSVDAVYDGEEALEYAGTGNYDGIILDLMMPKLDGMSVLKAIREKGDSTPVLILSAKSEIENKVDGLDAGANDYLTKPFEVRELLARIRAMTRSSSGQVDSTLTFGNVKLDCTNYTISTENGSTSLANKEFQVMEMLMRHPSHLISTEKFMERIWGYDSETEINVVWVYISYLRKKLAGIGADIRIMAHRGTGYSLEK